jgi:hypothetical protein
VLPATFLAKITSRVAESLTPALHKAALSRVVAAGDGRCVGQLRVRYAAQPSEQLGANRMEKVVLPEIESVERVGRVQRYRDPPLTTRSR